MPKVGTMNLTSNGGAPTVIDPYVPAATRQRHFRTMMKEQAALSDYNFLIAARELVAGCDVSPYFDGDERELTEKTARAALVARKLSNIDGRRFKTLLREYICKKYGIAKEKLTELTR
jgi:DNA/RNA-binding domain of Phe-tRNA-synthetase-like protein